MESVLEAIYEEDDAALEALDSDVEMFDAETLAATTCLPPPLQSLPPAAAAAAVATGPPIPPCRIPGLKPRKKKNKKKGRKAAAAPNITDINRFVIDTCRRLKERKSYLVWNAVGCLGVSAVRDLVKEVEVIMDCGGQKTADGSRFRFGGGILWNILKTREPKAYKEIMAKGREFEKQFKQPRTEGIPSRKNVGNGQITIPSEGEKQFKQPRTEGIPSRKNVGNGQITIPSEGEVMESEGNTQSANPSGEAGEVMESADQILSKKHTSVLDRIRVPVSYDDDLFEEGEIKESS